MKAHIARRLGLLVAAVLLALGAPAARAGTPTVTATLSSDQGKVGDGVELEIKVEGSQKVDPPEIKVDGLDIRCVGQSSQFSFVNGDFTRGIQFTYLVVPRREGVFTIPALTFSAGGKTMSTPALKLIAAGVSGGSHSLAGSGQSSQQPQQQESQDANVKFAFAQWVLPKTSLYVGEAVPAELWLYVDKRAQCQLQQVTAKADGINVTLQKLERLQPRDVTKDGRDMNLVVFKAAITPVKAGNLTLAPAEINAVAVLPQKRPRAPKMPGGFDAFFNDPFFNQAFNAPQQVSIHSDPVDIEAKPLPAAGKPRDFSGAVGQFTMETQAAPQSVKAGDPVTLTATVKGIGSFDRMNAPAIADTPGWRAYPPSGKFQQDDAVGISGEKIFEAALIPETAQTELPPITFSFFNPSTEKYETLKADRLAVTVEGSAPQPSPVAPSLAAAPSATPGVAAAPQISNDIQYLRTSLGKYSPGFAPAWETRSFWVVQGVAAVALAAFGILQWRRSRDQDSAHQRMARLHREKEKALALLRREGAAAPDFFNAAIRVLQIETALARFPEPLEPGAVDAELVCASRALDCETAEGVRRIFAAHDELRYAGGAASSPVAPDRRAQVLQILEQFETCHV